MDKLRILIYGLLIDKGKFHFNQGPGQGSPKLLTNT